MILPADLPLLEGGLRVLTLRYMGGGRYAILLRSLSAMMSAMLFCAHAIRLSACGINDWALSVRVYSTRDDTSA